MNGLVHLKETFSIADLRALQLFSHDEMIHHEKTVRQINGINYRPLADDLQKILAEAEEKVAHWKKIQETCRDLIIEKSNDFLK